MTKFDQIHQSQQLTVWTKLSLVSLFLTVSLTPIDAFVFGNGLRNLGMGILLGDFIHIATFEPLKNRPSQNVLIRSAGYFSFVLSLILFIVNYIARPSASLQVLQNLKCLTLIRLFCFVVRLYSLRKNIAWYAFIPVVLILIIIWLSAVWVYLGIQSNCYQETLNSTRCFLRPNDQGRASSWVSKDPVLILSTSEQGKSLSRIDIFCRSCYFVALSIFTIGYGDIKPVNENEYLLCCIILFCTVFLFNSIVSGFILITKREHFISLMNAAELSRLRKLLQNFPVKVKAALIKQKVTCITETLGISPKTIRSMTSMDISSWVVSSTLLVTETDTRMNTEISDKLSLKHHSKSNLPKDSQLLRSKVQSHFIVAISVIRIIVSVVFCASFFIISIMTPIHCSVQYFLAFYHQENFVASSSQQIMKKSLIVTDLINSLSFLFSLLFGSSLYKMLLFIVDTKWFHYVTYAKVAAAPATKLKIVENFAGNSPFITTVTAIIRLTVCVPGGVIINSYNGRYLFVFLVLRLIGVCFIKEFLDEILNSVKSWYPQNENFIYTENIADIFCYLLYATLFISITACLWSVSSILEIGLRKFSLSMLNSFYWCLTTVTTTGYGDIVPYNMNQTYVALVAIIVGPVLFAAVLSYIVNFGFSNIQVSKYSKALRRNVLTHLKLVLDKTPCDSDMAKRFQADKNQRKGNMPIVNNYLDKYLYNGVYTSELVSELLGFEDQFKGNIRFEITKELLRRSRHFRSVSLEFLHGVSNVLEERQYFCHDNVFNHFVYKRCHGLFFIKGGVINIGIESADTAKPHDSSINNRSLKPVSSLKKLFEGDCFQCDLQTADSVSNSYANCDCDTSLWFLSLSKLSSISKEFAVDFRCLRLPTSLNVCMPLHKGVVDSEIVEDANICTPSIMKKGDIFTDFSEEKPKSRRDLSNVHENLKCGHDNMDEITVPTQKSSLACVKLPQAIHYDVGDDHTWMKKSICSKMYHQLTAIDITGYMSTCPNRIFRKFSTFYQKILVFQVILSNLLLLYYSFMLPYYCSFGYGNESYASTSCTVLFDLVLCYPLICRILYCNSLSNCFFTNSQKLFGFKTVAQYKDPTMLSYFELGLFLVGLFPLNYIYLFSRYFLRKKDSFLSLDSLQISSFLKLNRIILSFYYFDKINENRDKVSIIDTSDLFLIKVVKMLLNFGGLSQNKTAASIFYSIGIIFICANISGCVFFLCGKIQLRSSNSSWLLAYKDTWYAPFCHGNSSGILNTNNLSICSSFDGLYGSDNNTTTFVYSGFGSSRFYLNSIYWATQSLVTVGYGDIVPVSPIEKVFTIILFCFGAVLISGILGQFQNVVQRDSFFLENREMSTVVDNLVLREHLDDGDERTLDLLVSYRKLIHDVSLGVPMQNVYKLLGEHSCWREYTFHRIIYDIIVRKPSILTNVHSCVLREICGKMKFELFVKGEIVIYMKQLIDDLNFVFRGTVVLNNSKISVGFQIQDDPVDFSGENDLIENQIKMKYDPIDNNRDRHPISGIDRGRLMNRRLLRDHEKKEYSRISEGCLFEGDFFLRRNSACTVAAAENLFILKLSYSDFESITLSNGIEHEINDMITHNYDLLYSRCSYVLVKSFQKNLINTKIIKAFNRSFKHQRKDLSITIQKCVSLLMKALLSAAHSSTIFCAVLQLFLLPLPLFLPCSLTVYIICLLTDSFCLTQACVLSLSNDGDLGIYNSVDKSFAIFNTNRNDFLASKNCALSFCNFLTVFLHKFTNFHLFTIFSQLSSLIISSYLLYHVSSDSANLIYDWNPPLHISNGTNNYPGFVYEGKVLNISDIAISSASLHRLDVVETLHQCSSVNMIYPLCTLRWICLYQLSQIKLYGRLFHIQISGEAGTADASANYLSESAFSKNNFFSLSWINIDIKNALLDILNCSLFLLFIAHVFACLLLLCSVAETRKSGYGCVDTMRLINEVASNSQLNEQSNHVMSVLSIFEDNGSFVLLSCLAPSSSYIRALYWALYTLSSVGFGTVKLEGAISKMISCSTMLCGCILSSYVAATIGSILDFQINKHNNKRRLYQSVVNRIKAYKQSFFDKNQLNNVSVLNNAPGELNTKLMAVSKYFRFMQTEYGGFHISEVWNSLPRFIKRSLFTRYSRGLRDLFLLSLDGHVEHEILQSDYLTGFLVSLIEFVKPYVASEGEVLTNRSVFDTIQLWILMRGEVGIFSEFSREMDIGGNVQMSTSGDFSGRDNLNLLSQKLFLSYLQSQGTVFSKTLLEIQELIQVLERVQICFSVLDFVTPSESIQGHVRFDSTESCMVLIATKLIKQFSQKFSSFCRLRNLWDQISRLDIVFPDGSQLVFDKSSLSFSKINLRDTSTQGSTSECIHENDRVDSNMSYLSNTQCSNGNNIDDDGVCTVDFSCRSNVSTSVKNISEYESFQLFSDYLYLYVSVSNDSSSKESISVTETDTFVPTTSAGNMDLGRHYLGRIRLSSLVKDSCSEDLGCPVVNVYAKALATSELFTFEDEKAIYHVISRYQDYGKEV